LSPVDLPCLLLLARTLVTSGGVSAPKISSSLSIISPRLRRWSNAGRTSVNAYAPSRTTAQHDL